MKKQFNLLGFIVILITITYSCSRTDEPCSSCAQKPEGIKKINLPFPDQTVSFSCNYYFGLRSENNPYQFGDCVLEKELFNILNTSVNKQIGKEISPYTIVFYFDNYLSKLKSSEACNIKGFSTFTYKNGTILHKLYKKVNQNFIESVEDSAEVNEIITNQLLYFLKNSFSISPASEKSLIIVMNKEFMGKIPVLKRNTLFLKQGMFKNLYNKLKSQEPVEGCGLGCDYNMENTYCVHDFWGYFCKEPEICQRNMQAVRLMNDTAIRIDTLYKAFTNNVHYEFRNNFLSNNQLGQKYITYYYEIGAFLGERIPLNLSVNTAILTFKVNDCLVKLLNPSVYGNSVVLDTDLTEDLISLFQEYKTLSNDATYLMYLDDIISDLNTFERMTVNEMLVYIK